jgi:hypothetical protein
MPQLRTQRYSQMKGLRINQAAALARSAAGLSLHKLTSPFGFHARRASKTARSA